MAMSAAMINMNILAAFLGYSVIGIGIAGLVIVSVRLLVRAILSRFSLRDKLSICWWILTNRQGAESKRVGTKLVVEIDLSRGGDEA